VLFHPLRQKTKPPQGWDAHFWHNSKLPEVWQLLCAAAEIACSGVALKQAVVCFPFDLYATKRFQNNQEFEK
jgi:hypothetical protein